MRVFVASDLEWAVECHGDGKGPEDRPACLGQQATGHKDQPAERADKEKSFANVWQEWQSEQQSCFQKDGQGKQIVASIPVGSCEEFVRIESEGSFAKRRKSHQEDQGSPPPGVG